LTISLLQSFSRCATSWNDLDRGEACRDHSWFLGGATHSSNLPVNTIRLDKVRAIVSERGAIHNSLVMNTLYGSST
jgi:hypothetical protein